MGIQIRPLTRSTANAASLGDYLAADEDLAAPSPNASPGAIGVYLSAAADRCIADAHQVHGGAAAALGLAGHHVTLARFSNMLEGRHVETGEQLTRPRAAPVYERDNTGRFLRDENRQKIRVLDKGKPKVSRDNELLGIEIITEHSPAIRCLLVAAEAAGATEEVERIKESLAQANRDFLAYVQQNVPLVRRTIPASMARAAAEKASAEIGKGGTAVLTKPETKQQGSKTIYVPGELAIIAVPQWTARSNAETDQRPSGMPDPAPHTHNIFAPVAYLPGVENDPVFGTQPGRFAKIDEYQLLKRAGELSAVHDGMTHKAITSLGYETEALIPFAEDPNGRHRWTIKGINPAAEEFFSSNSRRLPTVVAEWETKTGRTASPAMRTLLMRSTKGTKHKAQDSNPDWSHWVSDATTAGIEVASRELREKLMAPSRRRVERAPNNERVAELRRRLDGDNGFHREHATFSAVEARTTLMRAAEGLDFDLDELEVLYAEVMTDKDAVIALNPYNADGSPQDYDRILYTTPRMLNAEHQVAATIRYKSKATFRAVSRETSSKILAANAHLDAEQRQVYAAITEGRGLVMIEGPAGTGKTSSIRPAVEALRADEQINRVVVVSTAARTAAETGRKLGAEAAGAIERITAAVSTGSLTVDHKTLVVIDEAAMVDTARMERIASSLGAGRWVMAGDPHQMQPIGPGG